MDGTEDDLFDGYYHDGEDFIDNDMPKTTKECESSSDEYNTDEETKDVQMNEYWSEYWCYNSRTYTLLFLVIFTFKTIFYLSQQVYKFIQKVISYK